MLLATTDLENLMLPGYATVTPGWAAGTGCGQGQDASHLHSCRALTGCPVRTPDGEIGHVRAPAGAPPVSWAGTTVSGLISVPASPGAQVLDAGPRPDHRPLARGLHKGTGGSHRPR